MILGKIDISEVEGRHWSFCHLNEDWHTYYCPTCPGCNCNAEQIVSILKDYEKLRTIISRGPDSYGRDNLYDWMHELQLTLLHAKEIECPACHGSWSSSCSRCRGTGMVYAKEANETTTVS